MVLFGLSIATGSFYELQSAVEKASGRVSALGFVAALQSLGRAVSATRHCAQRIVDSVLLQELTSDVPKWHLITRWQVHCDDRTQALQFTNAELQVARLPDGLRRFAKKLWGPFCEIQIQGTNGTSAKSRPKFRSSYLTPSKGTR